jgi:enoyl-CoA hydratase/carnithine racemase
MTNDGNVTSVDRRENEATIVERQGGLVIVTLNRPRRKNAISTAMWNELDTIFAEVEVDPSARAMVLTGADGNFSAGADLSGEESNGLTGHGPQLVLGADRRPDHRPAPAPRNPSQCRRCRRRVRSASPWPVIW